MIFFIFIFLFFYFRNFNERLSTTTLITDTDYCSLVKVKTYSAIAVRRTRRCPFVTF